MARYVKIRMTEKQKMKFLETFLELEQIAKEENAPKRELKLLKEMIDIFERD